MRESMLQRITNDLTATEDDIYARFIAVLLCVACIRHLHAHAVLSHTHCSVPVLWQLVAGVWHCWSQVGKPTVHAARTVTTCNIDLLASVSALNNASLIVQATVSNFTAHMW